MKKLLFIFAGALFFYASQASAVFCTAQEYINPITGTSVWLFGDIHCDADAMMTMTRLQQHMLLAEAQKQNATIIAENVDCQFYNPYQWLFPFCLDAAILYKGFKNRAYKHLVVGAFFTALHSSLWYKEKSKTTKPTIGLNDHIVQLKKNSVAITVPCYSASPLWNIVQEAKKRGLFAVDLEFRYHMVGAYREAARNQVPFLLQGVYALAQMQDWMSRKLTGNAMRYPLTLSDYCRLNDAIIAEIKAYNSEPALHNFYQDCIENYTTSYMTCALRKLAAVNPSTKLATIVPALVEQTGKNVSTVLRDFAEHNVALFDARLLHAIVSHQDSNVFVCTGAAHMQTAIQMLEQLGYTMKSAYGKDNLKTLEERGAIGRTFLHLDDLDYLAVDLDKIFVQ